MERYNLEMKREPLWGEVILNQEREPQWRKITEEKIEP